MKKYALLQSLILTISFIFLSSLCVARETNRVVQRAGNADVISFNADWKFFRFGLQSDGTRLDEPENIYAIQFDDSQWENLDVPHDFAITGPFRMDLAGNTGRLPYKGIGWYRKTFTLAKSDHDKRIYIDFDGVMANAQIWLNGKYVGTWPYGYNSFRMDLTPYVKTGGKNVLAVRTDTERWDSRWYPGAGIYRNVWLVKTGNIQVKHWGTRLITTHIEQETAQIDLAVELQNHSDRSVKATIKAAIYEFDKEDRIGKKVLTLPKQKIQLAAGREGTAKLQKIMKNYQRWDITTPHRYVAYVQVYAEGKETDSYYTPFGIRDIKVTREGGVVLNGRRIEIKGVCNHHDLGALGAAFNLSALDRQLQIMQDMGCNSIRTSHNPPAPELLDLADKRGILILDEAFDAWAKGKREWDYNKIYEEWHEKDLNALVRRDWNHPSVYAWSIGNEVHEQTNATMTKHLADIVREIDPTRPVTNGYNHPDGGRESGAALALDIMGVNYFFKKQAQWDQDERYKDMPTIGSETSSCVSSRGVYFWGDTLRKNFQITSYDLDRPGWGCIPDTQFATNARFAHLLGEYVWTGFDYLGEPTPFNSDNTNLLNFRADPSKRKELEKKLEELKRIQPPSRSSYFGIVDMAGFPKDRYYLYQSHWRPELPMAHILPHWNWAGHEGEQLPVHVYTSATEAELFVNGKSYGRRVKEPGKTFRLIWKNVVYEPGTVKVIAYKDGKKWAEDEIQTTGKATKIQLISDKESIHAATDELAFVKIAITDTEGRIVPTACPTLHIEVTGCGTLAATDNGNPISFTPFQSNDREAFNGLALAIIRADKKQTGLIKITVTGKGLAPAELTIKACKQSKK